MPNRSIAPHALRCRALPYGNPEGRNLPSILAMAAFSATLLGLALPSEAFSLGLWPLGFIALAPLYESLRVAGNYRLAALAGAVFGAIQHMFSSYWLFFYKDFAFWTIGATTLGYAVVYTLPALYLSYVSKRSRNFGPILFALVWAVFEYGKSIGFLGYPYGLLPYSLSSVPLFLQVADITGVYGLSAILALSSAVFLQAIHPRSRVLKTFPLAAWGGFLFACLLIVLIYGTWRMRKPVPLVGSFRAAIVQQNIDPWIAGDEAALVANVSLARSAISASGSGLSSPPDLIIFSETSLRRPFEENRNYYSRIPSGDPLIPFLGETGSWLLTGAPYVLDWEEFKIMNAAILIDPAAKLVEYYGKTHPVPFTEAIPLMEFAWFRSFMKNVVGLDGGWTTGTRMTIFESPIQGGKTIKFGVPICFEDVFAGLCGEFIRGGADILINITNDSWSRKKSAQIQHWAAARFRAIETRRTLVRSTNGGLSCVVGPTGVNIFELPMFEARAEIVEIPVYKEAVLTLYTRYGDWFAWLCVLLSGISIIILARTKDTTRRIQ